MSRAGIEPAGSSPLTRGKLAAISQLLVGGGLIPAHAGKTDKCLNGIQSGSAHPRSRGENRSAYVTEATGLGSSPLTRGKPSWSTPSGDLFRLIPAHAGKTQRPVHRGVGHGAHPRSRGENVSDFARGLRGQGSSPLTRGKPRLTRGRVVRRGLIPAHAGKTADHRSMPVKASAHPRSRGENIPDDGMDAMTLGSSPLTRGKLRRNRVDRIGLRLIPAHAGKTGSSHVFSPRRSGSSPLTRGKRPLERNTEMHTRLIPAHAGKTGRYTCGVQREGAHPRSRGENDTEAVGDFARGGSSPLTRGKRGWRATDVVARGLIPAHAGKTPQAGAASALLEAHPRSRGENALDARRWSWEKGSSPLTRGKRQRGLAGLHTARLIPAHAGKTGPPYRSGRGGGF